MGSDGSDDSAHSARMVCTHQLIYPCLKKSSRPFDENEGQINHLSLVKSAQGVKEVEAKY